jgi:site-specific DNA-methyltransferase (adenine-specific)
MGGYFRCHNKLRPFSTFLLPIDAKKSGFLYRSAHRHVSIGNSKYLKSITFGNMIEKPEFIDYLNSSSQRLPLFIVGDCLETMRCLGSETIDCIVTSPPYWGQRDYANGGIGLEDSPREFINNLLLITSELKRVLKPTGSFWLNIGDTYHNKSLQGIPWRVAIEMTDNQKWTLRNSVIWNKHKGGLQSSNDRLRNVHENVFHFVKNAKQYYYDSDAIRTKPRETIIKNGSVISATGVSGIRYKRQIELSTSLNNEEKRNALNSLNEILIKIASGEASDFRMIIRNQQRATHSDSSRVSGRAKELLDKGFYFLMYHPDGTLPNDVWDIIPEDTQKREKHFAVFPEDLCRLPILATCPALGIVLDPFCGTGTTNKVALSLERKSIGIDISNEYIQLAQKRLGINGYNFAF